MRCTCTALATRRKKRTITTYEEGTVIKKSGKGYKVVSEKGKALSKPGISKAAATKRLRQVEFFKNRGKGRGRRGR